MLSFAIPGTVIGVSYILAFNVPPIEITGTALILVACNVFRNMPVGVRAGMASMAQIDRSLDEASATLGARGFTTLRRVLLPLLKPAIVAALVYSFVRAMTTVSAVIFLVSAEYEWATTYIINRVVNGDYGVAIAYCSVLIVLMLAVIWLIQRVGRRAPARARRERRADACPPAGIAHVGRHGTHESRIDRVRAASPSATATSSAVRDLSFTIAAGTLDDAARSVGLRQDDDAAPHRRPRAADRGRRSASAAATCRTCRRRSATCRWCSRATRCSRT